MYNLLAMINAYEYIGIYRHRILIDANPAVFRNNYTCRPMVNVPRTRSNHLPLFWRCLLETPIPRDDWNFRHPIAAALSGVLAKLNEDQIQPKDISDILRPGLGYLSPELMVP